MLYFLERFCKLLGSDIIGHRLTVITRRLGNALMEKFLGLLANSPDIKGFREAGEASLGMTRVIRVCRV